MTHASRPLHIVHTESSCGWGGQEIRILEESRGLIARGHRVTIVAPEVSNIFKRASEWGVPAVALPLLKKRPGPLLALRRWLRANAGDIDVINTHSSTDSWLAALARVGLGLPIVRTRHISAPVTASRANRWLYAKAAAHVVTTGEQLRRELVDNLGVSEARSTSIPTGIDTTRFVPGDKLAARAALELDANAFWVGIVATLRSWKGHAYLLEALANINDPQLKLAIVGDGPQRDNLRAKVAELGLESRVHFAGEQKNVPTWLQAFDAFALPSYANEGVSQAVMQAMSAGLPIITTAVGSMRDIIIEGQTGILVTPKDSTALAQAVRQLREQPELAAQLGAGAHAFAIEHCGLPRMLDRMERVFLNAATTP
ncbi:glycosyltransferase family 4 protein [Viridibacterium curvum]|uniref:Glycosyltransferase family 4 protein n=1 Tax=Viridibacterium curvum TaxID=1101404 RepID=A0ABP9QTS2_9RHOO